MYLLPLSRYWRMLLENSLLCPSHPCLTRLSRGTPCNIKLILINVVYTPLRSKFNGLQYHRYNMGLSWFLIHLAVAGSLIYEILRNFDRIQAYSSSRTSKVIDLGVSQKHKCNFLFVTLTVSSTVFEIWTFKARKWLVFPVCPLFDAPLGETYWNFGMKLTPQKLEGWGYHMVKIS